MTTWQKWLLIVVLAILVIGGGYFGIYKWGFGKGVSSVPKPVTAQAQVVHDTQYVESKPISRRPLPGKPIIVDNPLLVSQNDSLQAELVVLSERIGLTEGLVAGFDKEVTKTVRFMVGDSCVDSTHVKERVAGVYVYPSVDKPNGTFELYSIPDAFSVVWNQAYAALKTPSAWSVYWDAYRTTAAWIVTLAIVVEVLHLCGVF
jgi:hypothetical protein